MKLQNRLEGRSDEVAQTILMVALALCFLALLFLLP
jgi:hypothetical protein